MPSLYVPTLLSELQGLDEILKSALQTDVPFAIAPAPPPVALCDISPVSDVCAGSSNSSSSSPASSSSSLYPLTPTFGGLPQLDQSSDKPNASFDFDAWQYLCPTSYPAVDEAAHLDIGEPNADAFDEGLSLFFDLGLPSSGPLVTTPGSPYSSRVALAVPHQEWDFSFETTSLMSHTIQSIHS